MQLKAAAKKQLEAGIHPVTIKSVSYVKGANGQPASWPDPANNNDPTAALEILFTGKGGIGIKDTFWLALGELKKLTALMSAIGLDNSKGQVDAKEAEGKKLWLMVAEIRVFKPDMTPEIGTDGKQLSYGRACKKYWTISKEQPKVEGNPQDNDGVASGDFLFHFCDGKTFKPLPVEPEIEKWSANALYENHLTMDHAPKAFTKGLDADDKTEPSTNYRELPNERPFGAYEQRMKTRCEKCEVIGLTWNSIAKEYQGWDNEKETPIFIPESYLLNAPDEEFNRFINEIDIIPMIKTNPEVPGSFYNDQPVEQLQKPDESLGYHKHEDGSESMTIETTSCDSIRLPKRTSEEPITVHRSGETFVVTPFGITDEEPTDTTLKPFGEL